MSAPNNARPPRLTSVYRGSCRADGLRDPQTRRIKREVGIVRLVTRPFLDAVVQLVQQRGGPLLAHGITGSSHTLRDRG